MSIPKGKILQVAELLVALRAPIADLTPANMDIHARLEALLVPVDRAAPMSPFEEEVLAGARAWTSLANPVILAEHLARALELAGGVGALYDALERQEQSAKEALRRVRLIQAGVLRPVLRSAIEAAIAGGADDHPGEGVLNREVRRCHPAASLAAEMVIVGGFPFMGWWKGQLGGLDVLLLEWHANQLGDLLEAMASRPGIPASPVLATNAEDEAIDRGG